MGRRVCGQTLDYRRCSAIAVDRRLAAGLSTVSPPGAVISGSLILGKAFPVSGARPGRPPTPSVRCGAGGIQAVRRCSMYGPVFFCAPSRVRTR